MTTQRSDDGAPSCTLQQEEAITTVVRAVLEAKTTGVLNHYGMEACAGSGKTSTLVAMIERLHQVDPRARVLVLAFNVDAAAQLRHRLPPASSGLIVDVFTLHAYGMRILGAGSTEDRPIRFDPDKMLSKWQNMPGHTPACTSEWRRIRTHIDNTRRLGCVPSFQDRPLTLDDAVLEVMIDDRQTIDQDDQIYQCLVQQLTAAETYDLVLVDEAQDLNTANISFLRSVVAPLGTRTVLCAVGDPAQAIYAFRGADPDALQRYGATFRAQWLSLTCCFRCPRRVVFLASHLCSAIRHQHNAPVGAVRVLVAEHPWQTLLQCVQKHSAANHNRTLFLARNNRTLLAVLGHIYQTADCVSGIHWLSPGIARELRVLVEESVNIRLGDRLRLAGLAIEQHTATATDRIMHSILEMAIQYEGVERHASESPWLQWLVDVLDGDNGRRRALTVGTIHAVKGEEWPHVVIHDFNLFGQCEDNGPANQDRNLLYIAITRAQQSLTFLLTKRTRHVRSHLLPIDIVHYAGELWTDA